MEYKSTIRANEIWKAMTKNVLAKCHKFTKSDSSNGR